MSPATPLSGLSPGPATAARQDDSARLLRPDLDRAPRLICLTGATGFIGSTILRELNRWRNDEGATGHTRIRAISRRLPAAAAALADEWVPAELSEPSTLRGVCRDADVLLHAASSLDADPARCAAVNVRGTAALMLEAERAGTSRIVHLSTAAVYGAGPHRGIAVNEVEPAPVSAPSRTRLGGETYALDAGATVLRPGLVLGQGDRWVAPAYARLVAAVPALWGGGQGLHSVVAVEDLARLIAHIGFRGGLAEGRLWHASHPEPVRTVDLLRTLTEHRVLPPVSGDMAWSECMARLRSSGSTVSERTFSLLTRDHWYDSRDVWTASGCHPGPGTLNRLAQAAPWYRSQLGLEKHGKPEELTARNPALPLPARRRTRPATASPTVTGPPTDAGAAGLEDARQCAVLPRAPLWRPALDDTPPFADSTARRS
ncbi:NAD(P)-dependent oxidoreductase [Streptomyces sp. G44]|uniref:NAD-dependent epimerase/dehydratase family protein n=1 Tax=Streptomyces sp. G44 TaxID=2807632 RepID=UPI001961798E|nr:NAD(P)-dependent oxidoreductase [Streptomyces sp. G44]MBM7167688.1 NAD(P)-dependent oxidoreductase [Streptomyces sp. G44]